MTSPIRSLAQRSLSPWLRSRRVRCRERLRPPAGAARAQQRWRGARQGGERIKASPITSHQTAPRVLPGRDAARLEGAWRPDRDRRAHEAAARGDVIGDAFIRGPPCRAPDRLRGAPVAPADGWRRPGTGRAATAGWAEGNA